MNTRLTGLGLHAAASRWSQVVISTFSQPPSTTLPSTPAVLRPAFTSVTRRTLNRAFARERSISFCRLRTLFRSAALLAVKIRCRSRRTSPSTCRQSTAPQSRTSSSGPFTMMVSNLPLSSSVSDHLLSTGSPDPRQLPFGPGIRPYPTSYAQTTRRRMPVLRPAVSCCLSAIGIGFLGHPAPAGELSLPHGRPTGPQSWPDPNGVVVLHMSKLRPGRAPPLSRGRWCAPGRRLSSGRHLPLSCGQSLRPRWNNPSAGGTFTRRHRRFTAFTHHPEATGRRPEAGRPSGLPPVFSSPAPPGWNNGRFGFYLGLRTPQLPATHAKAETGHRALARVLRHRPQPGLQRRLPLALMHPHFARSPTSPPASPSGSRRGRAAGPARGWRPSAPGPSTPCSAGCRAGTGAAAGCTPSRNPWPRRPRPPSHTPARVLHHRSPAACPPGPPIL